jgi:imidazole glycerol phosphate synthase subunit HisF
VTLARRLCALLDVDENGRPARPYQKGGLDATFVEAVASFIVTDGADEVWLRAARKGPPPAPASTLSAAMTTTTPGSTQAPANADLKLLFEPLATLEKRVFAPLVAWAPVHSPADARLLLSFGADRVVVDVHRGLPDPLAFVERIVDATGPDRVTCAVHVRRVINDKGGVGFELVGPGGEGAGVNAIGLIDRLQQAGAAEVLVVPTRSSPDQERTLHDGELIEEGAATLAIPLLSCAEDVEIADVAAPLLTGADGVVTTLFAGGRPSLDDVRRALREYGVSLKA